VGCDPKFISSIAYLNNIDDRESSGRHYPEARKTNE
jgi:hypothetical protein